MVPARKTSGLGSWVPQLAKERSSAVPVTKVLWMGGIPGAEEQKLSSTNKQVTAQ